METSKFNFKWNGTDITQLLRDVHLETYELNKINYWRASIDDDNVQWFEVRTANTILPVIIDELKPVFGLHKLGTHWIPKKGKIIMLIRAVTDQNGNVEQDEVLEKFQNSNEQLRKALHDNQLFRKQMQEVYTFRDLLGISKNSDSSIRIRFCNNQYLPISNYEPNMAPSKIKSCLSEKTIQYWFADVSPVDCLKAITHIHNVDDIAPCTHDIKEKISDVINRIDKSYIAHTNYIIERILQRLQNIL